MTDTRCIRCGIQQRTRSYYITGAAGITIMCHLCMGKLTSTHSQIALAQRAPITVEQRVWVWKWFLTTKYFAFHRRMSRGRAKKLLTFMGGSELNPANVAIRGPHDLVTDAASLQTYPK